MKKPSKPLISLLHGFICSGKTTFARKLEVEENSIRLTHDERMVKLYGVNPSKESFHDDYQRVENLIWEMCGKLVRIGVNVIIDSGLRKRESRNLAISKANKLGVDIKLYWIYCSEEKQLERLKKRPGNKETGVLHINDEIFQKLKKNYEPLENDEIDKRIKVSN